MDILLNFHFLASNKANWPLMPLKLRLFIFRLFHFVSYVNFKADFLKKKAKGSLMEI